MGFVDETVVVAADIRDVYSRLLDYESYPSFMHGFDEVAVVGYCRLRWTGRVCGSTLSWETDVVDRVEDTRIRWRARDGRETGDVDVQKLDGGKTLIHYQLEYEPKAWGVDEESLRRCLHKRVRDDLQAFKALVEAGDPVEGPSA